MSTKEHWEAIYRNKQATEVSWYRPHLDQSLALLSLCNLPPSATVVDVGAGASTLVDDLIERGYTNLVVVDLSASALEQARERLGERADSVRWVQGDVTTPLLAPGSVDLWHDRAVFHFLTDPSSRLAYLEHLRSAVCPGGYALIGTFALDGPERCSGLPVVRYSPEAIAEALGPTFEKVADAREVHETPSGSKQVFSYALCQQASGEAAP